MVYRLPDRNLNDFNNELDHLVSIVSKENKTVFLLGGWNMNLMSHLHHQATSDFLELLFSRMFFSMITRPTRITSHTASLIDNIFTNEPLNKCISGLFLNDISDHLPIFAIISGFEQTISRSNHMTFREKTQGNLTKFKSEIKNVNWSELPDYNDPNQAYGHFLNRYTDSYNRCLSVKKVNTKKCTLVKSWITKALLKSIRKKNTLYKRFLNNPTPQRENLYKCYKNIFNHTLRLAKRLCYGKKIEEAKYNIKSTWRTLNEVLNNKSKKQNLHHYSDLVTNSYLTLLKLLNSFVSILPISVQV